jgi:glycosyltransferase involved in cell wall biosynthesis
MPAHIKIAYMGSFSPSTITEVYKNQHVLLLPTMNENYGHAIVESLSMGCPVIISDQTPWNDMHLRSAGYSIPLSNKALFVEKIEELAALNQSDWEQRSKAAKQYISEKLNIEKIKAQYIQLFT